MCAALPGPELHTPYPDWLSVCPPDAGRRREPVYDEDPGLKQKNKGGGGGNPTILSTWLKTFTQLILVTVYTDAAGRGDCGQVPYTT